MSQYQNLFSGLGSISGEYKIDLEDNIRPVALTTPRNVPLPLRDKVKQELDRMIKLEVISPIEEPTNWCSPMVVVPKPNGDVRLCVDLTNLNKNVKRQKFLLPDIEETLGQIGNSRVFSKLDANSGFWQIKLDPESAKLTTFITPFGRFFFKRLPFGISSASEYFQRRMIQLLDGLEGVLCHMDDILVHGATQSQHDKNLHSVLKRLQQSGMTLNSSKCEISRNKIKFLGHVIQDGNVSPDPERVEALVKLSPPTSAKGVRQFLGMANQFGKFISNLADKTKPLRDLLRSNNAFHWDHAQQTAFNQVINTIKQSVNLTLYNPNWDTVVSADASSYGIGAVILQRAPYDEIFKPVSFASKSLSDTEMRYAQIEKEAYAITWACERFSKFLIGKTFHIETDHKPLVPLLSKKDLSGIPLRIQRFKMRLMRYNFTISHTAGKDLHTADLLSRSPLVNSSSDPAFETEVEAFVNCVWNTIPATNQRLQQILDEQKKSMEFRLLHNFVKDGWPQFKEDVPPEIQKWWSLQGELTIVKGILCKGDRIIIPHSLRKDMLNKIHDGHLGIVRCLSRAKTCIFWPGITNEIKQMVEKCEKCITHSNTKRFNMIPTETPQRPWQKVGMDIMEWKKQQYLIVVDYFSRFIEMAKLSNITANQVIHHTKSIFARHGIPEVVFSDSGTQFVKSAEWAQFASSWGFSQVSSSPYYHQSNGEAERAVQTMKAMLDKCDDPYLGMMTYRATPNSSGYSPAELLMGRKIQTRLPLLGKNLEPKGVNIPKFRNQDMKKKEYQRRHYDARYRTKEESGLRNEENVFITDRKTYGQVKQKVAPRSYIIQTPTGLLRRNATMLRPLQHERVHMDAPIQQREDARGIQTRENVAGPENLKYSRYGRVIKAPDKLDL